MKILYVITGLAQGGAERVVCDLANSMYEKGHEVKIIYLTGEILTRPRYNEIEIIKINLNNFFSLFNAYVNLKKFIANYQPDVVHSHMVHANLLTRLVRLSIPIKKLISTAHSDNEGGILRMRLYRLTHHLSDLTTNVSTYASQSFIKKKAVPQNGISTIYNGVDFNNFTYHSDANKKIKDELNIDSQDRILLAVGRFHAAKNYPNLIEAIGLLSKKINNFVLLIAGDGDLRPEIEAYIQKQKIENRIRLLGRRSDIPTLMSACDVFILSSNYEGLPTVLIEALACQAHAVSTDVSGAREILDINGEIVPINSPVNLAQSIEILLDKKHKNKMGAEYVRKKFDLNIISDQWLEIYHEK